jgi:hypothetical protein
MRLDPLDARGRAPIRNDGCGTRGGWSFNPGALGPSDAPSTLRRRRR